MLTREQYLAGKVRRWHTHHSINQNNADHQWGVALVLASIHPAPTFRLLLAALLHDAGELKTGDLPSGAKIDPELKEAARAAEMRAAMAMGFGAIRLTQEEEGWLKLADGIEAWLFVSYCCVLPAHDREEIFVSLRKAIHKGCALLGFCDEQMRSILGELPQP